MAGVAYCAPHKCPAKSAKLGIAMQELSMNILDVAQNAVKAGATLCEIELREDSAQNTLRLVIRDNGCGMDEALLKTVTDPFVTSRSTRKVGLGLPFLKMAAEQTGGGVEIQSEVGKGTEVRALFTLNHIDLMPLGDIGATLASLCAGSPDMDFVFLYEVDGRPFTFNTREVREMLGDVSFSEAAVALFIKEYINEHAEAVKLGKEPAE